MKRRQLVLLVPMAVIVILSHLQVIWGYSQMQKTGYIFSINPVCASVIVIFWGAIFMFGILYALS